MQKHSHSILESFINIAVGYTVSVIAQILILPIFDIHIRLSDNLLLGLCFSVVSFIRSYVIRRIFNKIGSK